MADILTLNPDLDMNEVLHKAGSVVIISAGSHTLETFYAAWLIRVDVTRQMIVDASPPPRNDPRFKYLEVNDEIAQVAEHAAAMGWYEPIEFSFSTDGRRWFNGPCSEYAFGHCVDGDKK